MTPQPQPRRRLASVLTEVFSPAIVVVVLPYAVSYAATARAAPTAAWGTLVAVFAAVLPMGYIVWGSRKGKWDGHHVRERAHRLVPLAVLAASNLAGLLLTLLLAAPRPVIALQVSMLVSLVVTTAITLAWKISIHTAVAAGAVMVLAMTYGTVWCLAVLVVAAIGWARVACRDHTPSQVLAGAVLGAALGGGLFAALL